MVGRLTDSLHCPSYPSGGDMCRKADWLLASVSRHDASLDRSVRARTESLG